MGSGYVMQLQNFSVNDGEGIRTNVFLAGCPLRCQWCCNPEGQTCHNEYVRLMTADEVIAKLERQLLFYRFSGGGVTFSGGEATAQPEFLRELATRLYDMGVSLALESCGSFDYEAVRDVLAMMDLVFLDIKHMNPKAHKYFTGFELEPILQNIRRVHAQGVPMCIRIPTIIGVNASEGNIRATFEFVARELPNTPLELLPYHRFGEDKYIKLGLTPPSDKFATPTDEQLAEYAAMARGYGIEVRSYK